MATDTKKNSTANKAAKVATAKKASTPKKSARKKTPVRGGHRDGSGRKNELGPKIRKTIDIPVSLAEGITKLGKNVSTFIREAAEVKLKQLQGIKAKNASKKAA